jgi:hypothetical protein
MTERGQPFSAASIASMLGASQWHSKETQEDFWPRSWRTSARQAQRMIGADKDSDKRQRQAIAAFAQRSGLEPVGELTATGCTEGYGGLHERLWGVSSSSPLRCAQPLFNQARGLFMNEVSRSNRIDDVLSLQVRKHWARADLFFLKDSLERGMSLAEIAGFLRRTGELSPKVGDGGDQAAA